MARPRGRNSPQQVGLTNEQVVVLAVAALGGQYQHIDTEDVAVKADEIAPQRFRWRKYPDFINNELVHTALRDAKRHDGFVSGSGREGWQLTPQGQSLVTALQHQGNVTALPRRGVGPKEQAWRSRERARLLGEEAYRKYQNGEIDGISSKEAERFFRLDEYVIGEARKSRLQRIRNAFGNDPELGQLIEVLVRKIGG